MAAVNIRGKFLYMPGPWGMTRPAAGVSFTIVDRDLGNADDTIFNGMSNANGDFAGTTSDWRDSRSVTVKTPVGSYATDVADVSDVMALWLEVRQQIGNRSYSISLPYVPPPPGLPAPVLVLPWAPPGRTQIRINGVAKRTLNDCSQAIQSLFANGAAVAGQGVSHEIAVYGEQVGQVRQQLAALNGAIESILLAIDTQRAQEHRSAELGALEARLQGAKQIKTSLVAAASGAVNIGQLASIRIPGTGPTSPGLDPWDAIRQQIVTLVQSTEQVARNAAAQCGASGAALTILSMIVVTLVSIVIAVVAATFTFGSFAGGGATVVALAVVAIVSALVTIVANMPALLNAVAAMLGAVGMTDAASAVRGASGDLGAWMDSNHWFGSCVLLIAMACAILILMLSAPADGWTWLVENVNGSDGVLGMRFVFTR